jgi:hypothetical protein
VIWTLLQSCRYSGKTTATANPINKPGKETRKMNALRTVGIALIAIGLAGFSPAGSAQRHHRRQNRSSELTVQEKSR